MDPRKAKFLGAFVAWFILACFFGVVWMQLTHTKPHPESRYIILGPGGVIALPTPQGQR